MDGDGQRDDSQLMSPSYTYVAKAAPYWVTVRLRVRDDDGATSTDQVVIAVGNTPPTATILAPSPTLTWRVGEQIFFSGQGTDIQNGTLPPSSMNWEVILQHCPGGTEDCHPHSIQQFNGVDHGIFTAPDHEYYSYLQFRLTVKDSGNLIDQEMVSVEPETVSLTFRTNPPGLNLVVGGISQTTPFTPPSDHQFHELLKRAFATVSFIQSIQLDFMVRRRLAQSRNRCRCIPRYLHGKLHHHVHLCAVIYKSNLFSHRRNRKRECNSTSRMFMDSSKKPHLDHDYLWQQRHRKWGGEVFRRTQFRYH